MTHIASTSTITYPAETVQVLALWMSTWRWMEDHRAILYGMSRGLLQKVGWKQNLPSVHSGHIFIRYEFVYFSFCVLWTFGYVWAKLAMGIPKIKSPPTSSYQNGFTYRSFYRKRFIQVSWHISLCFILFLQLLSSHRGMDRLLGVKLLAS